MTTFPALTVWQPWASLIMAGAKPYEFRSHPAPRFVRGCRIAIHAGKRKVVMSELRALRLKLRGENHTGLLADIALPLLERWCQEPLALPLASVIGTALLGEPIKATLIPGLAAAFENDSDRAQHANWGWPLTEIDALPPTPARGAQGFWTWRVAA